MKIIKIKLLLFVYFFVLSVFFLNGEKVRIYHFNDLHSKIRSLSKISFIVNNARKQQKNVFLVNAGDNVTGNPYVDMYNPPGWPVMELFNQMDLDAIAIGNHEFDLGEDVLTKFLKEGKFKSLAANIGYKKNLEIKNYILPYTVLQTKEGNKICFIGLTQVEKGIGIPATAPKNVLNFSFYDPVKTLEKYKNFRGKYSAIILLSHAGIDADKKIAEKHTFIDVIISGHNHITTEMNYIVNKTLISQVGSYGKFLGVIELVIDKHNVLKKENSKIKLKRIKKYDKKIQKRIKKYENNKNFRKKIAYLKKGLKNKKAIGHMCADGLRKKLNVDISFVNSGGVRISNLGGTVRVKDIYSLHPFKNKALIYSLKYDEIKNLLKESFVAHSMNLDLYTSGCNYKIKYSKRNKIIESIRIYDKNKKELSRNKKYRVAVSDYLASRYKISGGEKNAPIKTNLTMAEITRWFLENNKINSNYYNKVKRAKAFNIDK